MGDYGDYEQRGYGGGGGGGGYGGGRGGGRGGGGRGGRGGGRGRDGGSGPDYYTNPNAENFCKIFLGGLAPETTEDSLKDHFGTYGTIVDCVVMRDVEKKRSRGFGFVTFEQSNSVTDVQGNRPHIVDGKKIETKRATPKHQQAEGADAKVSTKKLFVGGVKDEMTESMFREEFSKFGTVTEIKIIQGKGFAFVTFDDHDAVDFCNLVGRFEIGDKWVNAKKAQEKNKDGGMGGGGGRGGFQGGRGGGGGRSSYGSQGGYGGGGGSYGESGCYGNYGGNDYGSGGGGGFGQDYGSSYGGGAMKSSGGGYGGGQRSQPYSSGGGGGYGGGQSGYASQGGGYASGGGAAAGGYDSYGSQGGGSYSSGGGGGGGYQGGSGGYQGGGGGYQKR